MTEAFRTPEERFAGLPDFDFEPHYRQVGDLRLAHIDTGEGPPVVMLHGEPTWSFLWRKVIPPIRDAGFRCLAPDHAGFGRSDKPLDESWHSADRHIELTGSLLEDLDLRDVTMVGHDWGGPIGLTIALEQPERVSRIVILDTAIDFRETWASENWVRFRNFVERTEDLPIGQLIRGACYRELDDAVVAAYEAPFPTRESKAATRGLPLSVPPPDDPEIEARTERFYEALRRDARPVLILWAQYDFVLTLPSGERLASRIGTKIDHVIPDAGHGIQEDQGQLVGSLIADWLSAGG